VLLGQEQLQTTLEQQVVATGTAVFLHLVHQSDLAAATGWVSEAWF
jgi:hypothetical protein